MMKKINATIIAYSAALVAAKANIIAAHDNPEFLNSISEQFNQYNTDIEGYDELPIIFGENVEKDSCKPAIAKLQKCTSAAVGEDPKWQESIMTAGRTARGCLQQAKHERQRDSCMKPFMKVLEVKCSKETKKMIDNQCKIYNEERFGLDILELLMNGNFDQGSKFEESTFSFEDGVLDINDSEYATPQCKIELMQLHKCVDKNSEKDRTFHSTVETAASVERICLQAATKKSQKKACTKQLKVILQSTCPKETKRVLKACSIKTGELRATRLR